MGKFKGYIKTIAKTSEKYISVEKAVCVGEYEEFSLLRKSFKDYANALDDKHFSSNAGDAIRGRGETKYRKNESERSLCQISHDICTTGTISVPSVKTSQGDGRA